MTSVKLIRHETAGNMISAYRGEEHLGLIYCPTPSGGPNYPGHDDYHAVPTDNTREAARFATEDAAAAYLAA